MSKHIDTIPEYRICTASFLPNVFAIYDRKNENPILICKCKRRAEFILDELNKGADVRNFV